MPFRIATLTEIVTRTQGAFRANLRGSDAALWPNNVSVSAKVIAAAVREAFAFLDYISKQHIAHLAEGIWLERKAYDYGIARLGPTYATGKIVIHGDVGIAVPSGIIVQLSNGVQYVTSTAGVTDGSGNFTANVKALTAGRAGNALAGASAFLTTPLSSLDSEALVHSDGIGGGADTESDAGLRERLLARLRFPPHGGAVHDYVNWVRDVNAGITRVFVDPVTATNGRDSVGIWFLMDDTYANGIPQTADVTAVAAYIDVVRPAGALVEVQAPTPDSVNIEIDELSTDSVAVREAIATELRALFRRVGVSTATNPVKLYRSQITEAIAAAVGEAHHVLVEPATDELFSTGEIPTLGTLTFT